MLNKNNFEENITTKNVPIQNKVYLTIQEASKYSGIGVNKLRQMVDLEEKPDWIVRNGNRKLIKRVLFEEFLLDLETI